MTGTRKKNTARELAELVSGLECNVKGNIHNVFITAVVSDSRKVVAGSLFVAVAGLTVDGHQFVEQAIAGGCAAVMVGSEYRNDSLGNKAIVIKVDDPQNVLGIVAGRFYGNPADEMCLIGITGTNGKTTTSYLLEEIVKRNGGLPGVIGTVSYRYSNKEIPAPFTTPEPVSLHEMLREMSDNGVTHVMMEVSSHALEQKRLQGIMFDVAVFTNLSRDHLDYHGDMERYFNSKKKLFTEHLKQTGTAVICETQRSALGNESPAEGDWGKKLHIALADQQPANEPPEYSIIECGLAARDIYPTAYSFDLNGINAEIMTPKGKMSTHSPLVGDFNLNNILVSVGVGLALDVDLALLGASFENITAIPGRLERVLSSIGVEVFVDYAHTPDALENVLTTLKKLEPQRLIVVFGCGGDRDRGKRPIMGDVAAELADVVVITSDNPRSEDPFRIIEEIEEGVLGAGLKKYSAQKLLREDIKGFDIIESREEAIGETISNAKPGDVVLICGKGHENYQITQKGKSFFDDRIMAKKYLGLMSELIQGTAAL